MATYKTDVQTGQTGFARDRIEGQRVTGEFEFAEVLWTLPAGVLTNDIIELVTLPVGAVVYPEYSRTISNGTGGTSTSIAKIGDYGDDDRYSVSVQAVNTAANAFWIPAPLTSVFPRYVVTKDTAVVTATITHGGAPTAGQKLQFIICFRMP